MGHPDWTPGSPVKESKGTFGGAVYELVDEDNVSRVDVFLERAAGRGDYHVGTAFLLQSVYVGSVVDLGGREAVLSPMSVCGQK